jgi:hypothetical protein
VHPLGFALFLGL